MYVCAGTRTVLPRAGKLLERSQRGVVASADLVGSVALHEQPIAWPLALQPHSGQRVEENPRVIQRVASFQLGAATLDVSPGFNRKLASTGSSMIASFQRWNTESSLLGAASRKSTH